MRAVKVTVVKVLILVASVLIVQLVNYIPNIEVEFIV
jgi:hypothetical protein